MKLLILLIAAFTIGYSVHSRTKANITNLYDEKGNERYSIKAKTRLNIVNLREIPSGTYLLTAEVDKEVTTWEIVKE